MMKNRLFPLCVAVAAIFSTAPALADEREDLETLRQTTLNLIQALVQTGILSQEKANTLIAEAKRSASRTVADQNPDKKVVRVPYVPQTVRNEIKEELRKEVMAQARSEGWAAPNETPSWIKGTKWESDIRVRYQQDRFDKNNFSPLLLASMQDPINVGNSQQNNDRWRTRLRFGMETQVSDMTSAGFRIATGNSADPLSTNQTMGNSFNRYTLGVDRAYLNLRPTDWLTFTAGRMANPFLATELVWHPDLSFDGVVAALRPRIAETANASVVVGAFPVMKLDPSPTSSAESKWLYAAQAGIDGKAGQTAFKAALAYYDFRNVEGKTNPAGVYTSGQPAGPYDQTAAQFKQKGNSLFDINRLVGGAPQSYGIASQFREIDLAGSVDLAHLDPVHVILAADYVKNIGFDRAEIRARTGRDIEPRTLGRFAKLTVGMPTITKRGEWQVFGAYKYLQRDAVLDAFTDSDFRLGGTDAKGYIIGGSYGIDKNTWLSMRWLSADPIDGPPLAIDTLQVDLNVRF